MVLDDSNLRVYNCSIVKTQKCAKSTRSILTPLDSKATAAFLQQVILPTKSLNQK